MYIDLYSKLHTCTDKYDAHAVFLTKRYNVTPMVLHVAGHVRQRACAWDIQRGDVECPSVVTTPTRPTSRDRVVHEF